MKLDRKNHLNKSGIYCIQNKVNGKMYVGKSKNIYGRIKQHITNLNRRVEDENRHLINSWHKYGRANFRYYVLEYCPINILNERELFWIEKLNTLDRNIGYNLRLDTETGVVVSTETRLKLSQAMLNRFTPEFSKKLSASLVGKTPDEEARRLMSKRRLNFKILKFNKDGVLLDIFESLQHLLDVHPTYKWQNVYAACNGSKPTYRSFYWRYWPKDQVVPQNIRLTDAPIIKGNNTKKRVHVYDKDFNRMAVYESAKTAAAALELNSRTIASTCRGDKLTFYHAGFYFYYDETLPGTF